MKVFTFTSSSVHLSSKFNHPELCSKPHAVARQSRRSHRPPPHFLAPSHPIYLRPLHHQALSVIQLAMLGRESGRLITDIQVSLLSSKSSAPVSLPTPSSLSDYLRRPPLLPQPHLPWIFFSFSFKTDW